MKDVRYPYDATWPQQSQALKEQGITRTGKVPALEYKGQILTQVSQPHEHNPQKEKSLTARQHIPILRYLARDLGDYDGQTNWEKYVVDAVADIYIDWRVRIILESILLIVYTDRNSHNG